MTNEPEIHQVAEALQGSIGLMLRRLRQVRVAGDLSMPASSAVARLHRDGPATSAELARAEQVSPQSMGATLAGLEASGLIERSRDAADGRRVVLGLTEAGRKQAQHKRSARTDQLAAALSDGFTAAELRTLEQASPLLERLAKQL